MLEKSVVEKIFHYLVTDNQLFFQHVADDVSWTVMGTHPLAGHYHDKDSFIDATFTRLRQIMTAPVSLVVDHVYVDGDIAIVEMHAQSTLINGKPFCNQYCWVTRFEQGKIVTVRAYLDSALVASCLDELEQK